MKIYHLWPPFKITGMSNPVETFKLHTFITRAGEDSLDERKQVLNATD
jgi:hypothetical protein